MPRFRISLASLLGIVAVIAMGLAGMLSASSLWTTAAATVTLAVLLTALLAARLLAGVERAFWSGFALFGWTYLLLVNWDWVGGQFGHDLTADLSEIAESIFVEVPITAGTQLPAVLPGQPPAFVIPGTTSARGAVASVPPGANPIPSRSPTAISNAQYLELVRARQIRLGNFVQIGRMFLSLVFGLLGGWIAHALAQRRESAA